MSRKTPSMNLTNYTSIITKPIFGNESGEWFYEVDFADSLDIIRENLQGAAKSFITIGFYLKHIKEKDKDLLQRSYEQLASLFGESKRSVTDAIVCLEGLGVIKRVFRTIEIGGLRCNNVLYLQLFPEVLHQLTYPKAEADALLLR